MQATKTPREILREVFGYSSFRVHQEDIINQIISGGDAFVLMPTGGGKSLCFQIPAMLRPGVGIIISPLIALMQDQVHAMHQLGIRAAYLNSTLNLDDAYYVEEQLLNNKIDLLYIAPERLFNGRTLSLLDRSNIALFAIDEAHCVSQWGHDFREEYLQLNILHERYPDVPRIACTATADSPTRDEIIERLNLNNAKIYITGFDRPNIKYRIIPKKNAKEQLLRFLEAEHLDDSGIVYCLSRKKTEETAEWLCDHGRTALPYHAGMDSGSRKENQDRFLKEDNIIIVATIAFGMGIDKPDVRFVAHLDLPKSIEAYYQETGRAGRDGFPADAFMTYGLSDVVVLRQIMDKSYADYEHKLLERSKLNALINFCETTECRRKTMLNYFGENYSGRCYNCDTCLDNIEEWDATIAAKKALFCIYETRQRFGAKHLIDVLTGKNTERIRQFGHDNLRAYGGGKEHSKHEWSSIFRQLVALGIINVDVEFGSMKLTEECRDIMKGEREIRLRKDPEPEKKKKKRKEKAQKEFTSSPTEDQLFEILRDVRLKIAREADVPAYMIFHDSTLREMANIRPANLEELSEISGVGKHKLAKFGKIFLEAIGEFVSS